MSDDLIRRQDAIDAIGKISDEMYRTVEKGATFPPRAWFDGMAQAEHIVKNLPFAQPEPQWIPCSERLPEENQICIVTDETRQNTYEYRFCKLAYDEEQGWTYLKHRIIAWMPLPEPWKGEQE